MSPTLTPPRSWSGADGAGFLLGLVGYALALNVIRHGPEGARAWLRAKFLNKPTDFAGDRVMPALPPRRAGGLTIPDARPPGAVSPEALEDLFGPARPRPQLGAS